MNFGLSVFFSPPCFLCFVLSIFRYLFTVSSLCFFPLCSLFLLSVFLLYLISVFFYSVLCLIFCALFLYSVLSELLFSCCVFYLIFCIFSFLKISYIIVNGNYTSVVTRVKERFPGSGSIEVCFSNARWGVVLHQWGLHNVQIIPRKRNRERIMGTCELKTKEYIF
jgi:hypothetical protein